MWRVAALPRHARTLSARTLSFFTCALCARGVCVPRPPFQGVVGQRSFSGGGGRWGKGDDDADPRILAEVVGTEDGPGNALSKVGIGENAPQPPHLLAVPIQRRPLFPGFMAPLFITDEALIEAMIALKKSPSPLVGVFLLKDGSIDATVDKFSLTSMDQVHTTGTLAHIQQMEAGPGGAIAMLMAHRRIVAREAVNLGATPPLIVRVSHLVQAPLEEVNSDNVKAMSNEILATLRDIIRLNPLFQQHVSYFARRIDVTNPYALADFSASLTTADAAELQDVLETLELEPRLGKALLLLKKEAQLSALQQSIKADVEKRIDKQQRQYFLMEQLKSIKKELGLEKDDKDALVTKFTERVAKLDMPASARTVFDEELEKLQVLERNSSEFNVTRTYLDWLTSIPWGKYSPDNFDLRGAKAILDEDHYGMADVKDRILEFIAVGKLKGSVQGKILCFVGPPGVGKTSIGKSIARALSRTFYRFSVGGLSDVAEIKGHRRTYIGAMPGKLIQCMKSTGVSNPLVLIDEIDKIGVGRGYSGDPSSALLEMLDPNQNGAFLDHYLDTPVDASKVLFICTANSLDTIPGPLLDRMEVIRLAGYDQPEKMAIARQYLDGKTRAEMGLEAGKPGTPTSLSLTDSALEHLIRWYAREAGVRNLEKLISKVYRKAAIKIVAAREAKVEAEVEAGAQAPAPAVTTADAAAAEPPAAGATASATPGATPAAGTPPPPPPVLVEDPAWTVTADNLSDYVGKPVFTSDRLYDVTPPGVVMGLAWTTMGGSALYIEVVSPRLGTGAPALKPAVSSGEAEQPGSSPAGSPGLRLTGKMGDVMQESAQIAYTLARRILHSTPGQENNSYLDVMPLHMHVPEGATPKDGPSAGITMTTALLSAATGLPVRPDLAMTGEVTLTGKVLPVGGIKEKVMASRRAAVTTLVLPAGCRKDYEELGKHLKEGITVHFVERYEEVYPVAFVWPASLADEERGRQAAHRAT